MSFSEEHIKACTALRTGRKKEAEKILKDIIKRDKSSSEAWLLLSLVQEEPKQIEICEKVLRGIHSLPSSSPSPSASSIGQAPLPWYKGVWTYIGTVILFFGFIVGLIADVAGAGTALKEWIGLATQSLTTEGRLHIAVRDAFRCATDSDIALIQDPTNPSVLDACWVDPGRAAYIRETNARWTKSGLHACLSVNNKPKATISNFEATVFPESDQAEVHATVAWVIIPCDEQERVQCDDKWTAIFKNETYVILTRVDGAWKVSRREETPNYQGSTTAAQYCSFHNIPFGTPEVPTSSPTRMTSWEMRMNRFPVLWRAAILYRSLNASTDTL